MKARLAWFVLGAVLCALGFWGAWPQAMHVLIPAGGWCLLRAVT